MADLEFVRTVLDDSLSMAVEPDRIVTALETIDQLITIGEQVYVEATEATDSAEADVSDSASDVEAVSSDTDSNE